MRTLIAGGVIDVLDGNISQKKNSNASIECFCCLTEWQWQYVSDIPTPWSQSFIKNISLVFAMHCNFAVIVFAEQVGRIIIKWKMLHRDCKRNLIES